MVDALKQIALRLKNDNTLTSMLASNAPFYKKDGTPTKPDSIIPFTFGSGAVNTPYITIQEGVANRLGEKLMNETFYIRVYNSPTKAFVEIGEIADRIIALLDDYNFTLDGKAHVQTRFETMLASAQDQAYNQNFRELRFEMRLL